MIVSPIIPVRPIVPPVIYPKILPMLSLTRETALSVLAAILLIATSVLVAWCLTGVMKSKGTVTCLVANLIGAGIITVGLFLRFGLSVTLLQGIFLLFALLYASMSDLTTHTVDDAIWVLVFALSLVSIPTLGLTSMVAGAFCVFIPQMAMALIPPHKTLGGADIKLSTALAFLLGFPRGIVAYLVGLAVAVIYMAIYNKIKKRGTKKPFALVPFMGIAAMIIFFV